MRKAKLILTIIAFFGVAGGVLAFKASKFGSGNLWIFTTTTVGGQSTFVPIDFVTIAPAAGALRSTVYYSTNPPRSTFTYITTVPEGL
jgi:hypothetical protein